MINLISDIVILICLFALSIAIILNFFESNNKIAKEKKSVVETGSMVGFFVFFYALIRFKIGFVSLPILGIYIFKIIGLITIIFGCYINILGRRSLGKNWANQVTIYQDQTLIQKGAYKYVRHPLYSSIIWMFYGSCLVYSNYYGFIATTLIFIPFMYYRAKQEEKLLSERFEEYKDYQKKTGMFFPKFM